MFSTNKDTEDELRKHQKRVAEYVELAIPQRALEAGTSVLVMQISCETPGCSPLETVIVIVFPKAKHVQPSLDEWIPGLPQSVDGGHFQTKVFLPLSVVTRDHVLDSLPPAFVGGRKCLENDYIRARDQMLNQIEQTVGQSSLSDEEKHPMKNKKMLMAKYLIQCLKEYIENDCTLPPSPLVNDGKQTESPRQQIPEIDVVHGSIQGSGNFIIRRNKSDKVDCPQNETRQENAMDWRRRTIMEKNVMGSISSTSTLQHWTEMEHVPGIRKPGCPCCDPDNVSNLVEQMLSM
jgi:hypothetical protein